MIHHEWKEHVLHANGHQMAWYEIGQGPTVMFLHGGYDHLLYRPMAELIADRFRCVLYDQRGSGRSKIDAPEQDSMHVRWFVKDIEVLRHHLGLGKITLLGHSWGANLALLYAQEFPDTVARLILVGPGPLSDEMKEYYEANVTRMMDPADRGPYEQVGRAYKEARAAGAAVPRDVDEANIRMWAPVIFYSRSEAERFVDAYLEAGGSRRHIPDAQGLRRGMEFERAGRITAPTMVVYGYQDYEPITQAYLIKEHIPQTRVTFLNECGHMVWLDQPEGFRESISMFIDSADPEM